MSDTSPAPATAKKNRAYVVECMKSVVKQLQAGSDHDVRCAATVLNWIDYLEGTTEAPSNPREKRHARTD